jgi:hypothetical protein
MQCGYHMDPSLALPDPVHFDQRVLIVILWTSANATLAVAKSIASVNLVQD